MVLVELALQIGALDTEVCGKEQASKLRDQLFLSIGGASEPGVEFTGEGGWVSGGVGHLMQQERVNASSERKVSRGAMRMRSVAGE